MTDAILPLADAFPPADEAAWRALVGKVLKGADFDKRLVRRTYDGIPVQPLYHPGNAGGLDPGWPGQPPLVRGAVAAGQVAGGWDIRQLHAHPDPLEANRQILEDLERGVTSIRLRLDSAAALGDAAPDGVMAYRLPELEATLDGVRLDLAPVALDAGPRFAEAAALFLALLDRRGEKPETVAAALDADPLGAVVRGAALDPATALRRAGEIAVHTAAEWPRLTSLLADGRPYHAAGASEAQELAAAVATFVTYLRALERTGLGLEPACRQIRMALAADTDFFLTVAKLRAARRLWGEVLATIGVDPGRVPLRLDVETAPRMLARRDPWVNLLRTTVAALAAGLGGADTITVLPFDQPLGLPDAFARRIARNIPLVAMEESNVHRVVDPAGGSWCVERLTDELAQRAWALVQEIERAGGMTAALAEGLVQREIARGRAARHADVATRRHPLTGISEFPDLHETPRHPLAVDIEALKRRAAPVLDEALRTGATTFDAMLAEAGRGAVLLPDLVETSAIPSLPPHRLAEDFEQLRDRSDHLLALEGARPRIFSCNLGRLAEHGARATFAKNLFEAGGIEVVPSEPITDAAQIAGAFRASGAAIAVVCSSDAVYAEQAEAAVRALHAAGCRRVWLAGRPDDELRARLEAAGVGGFVHSGANVLMALEAAYHALEARAPEVRTETAPSSEARA